MDKQIDFLGIGDIVAEPFIKIKDAEETCDKEGHCKLCLGFGEKIPYESALVCYATGNSSNAAISASKLGLNSSLVSYVGNDEIGKKNIERLIESNVHTEQIMTVPGMDSNYHYVLWYDTERTILVKHTEFPYSFPSDLPEPKWVYLSSLASNSIKYHEEIIEYLKKHPDIKLAFQPGTFQIKLGIESLKEIYEETEILFCNKEEAQKILKTTEVDINKLLEMLKSLGPKIVVITDAKEGAYAYDGVDLWHVPAYNMNPVERTGAGDSFSSAFIAGLIYEKTISESLMWGSVNSMSVISQVGPHKGLLSREEIEEYIKNISEENKPRKLN